VGIGEERSKAGGGVIEEEMAARKVEGTDIEFGYVKLKGQGW
jgi:hypothetical protein